jgi:hypothetical protein
VSPSEPRAVAAGVLGALRALAGRRPVLPETVEELLGTRVTRLPQPVRRLLLALSLSGELEASQLPAIAGPAVQDDAIDLGVVRIDGTRIRASHPLLAAAAKKRSGRREHRELHRALAAVAADEGLRAHHLALASRDQDEQLAATVAAAAGRAFARGARREAVELGEHALRLTPAGSRGRPERLLTLADYLETAGEADRLKELLTANLDSIPGGPVRARASASSSRPSRSPRGCERSPGSSSTRGAWSPPDGAVR